jgi:hypothetical protein
VSSRGQARGRAAQTVGCLFAGLGLLWLGGILLAWLFGVWIDREDWSDIRFNPLVYLGRTCRALQIEGQPYDGAVVTITNNRGDTVHDLRITMKYYLGNGPRHRPVVEHYHAALASGERVSFDPPDRNDMAMVGMIQVHVECDEGYATHKGWFSFWS